MKNKIDKNASLDERINFLRCCASEYEHTGTSPISDKQYDSEYYELEQLDPENSFFSEVGGKIDEHIYGTLVKHDVIMGSLSKCPDTDSFLEWIANTFKSDTPCLVLQHKIDGLSLSLLYRDGKLARALTRGDGIQGVDVTLNARYVEGVPDTIECQDEVEVRGECYKKRDDFYAKWHKSVGGKYANPRNFSAGSLNQKNAQETQKRGLSFIAYEVVRKDFSTEVEKNKWIKKMGFANLWHKGISTFLHKGLTFSEVKNAVQEYMDNIDRAELQYDIDGVVVKINDIELAKSMGATSGGKKPKSARAVKFPPEEKETILIGVESNVGRTGAVTPVAQLEPVELGGAMISRATLHNWGALIKGQIKINAKVVIAKKGDIIPQIISVKEAGDVDLNPPSSCPACGEVLEWDNTHVNLVCNNECCVAQMTSRIDHWFKKLGCKGVGPKMIEKLSANLRWDGAPIVSQISDMYYSLEDDSDKVKYLKSELGSKSYQNTIQNIHSVKEITLSQFIQALGIANVGTLADLIVEIAPTVEDIDKLTVSDLIKLDKFAEKKATSFVKGWGGNREEIKTLLKYISIKKQEVASDALSGKKFCFTGSFSKPRKELQDIAVANGGKAASSVGKGAILVWDGETTKGKYEKAKEQGNEIISEDEFNALIN